MKRPSPTTTGERGFTLVEVILTLLIISGILLSLTQLLMATRRSRDIIHNVKEQQLAGPAILDLIEADLRGIVVYNRTRLHHISIQDDMKSGGDADRLDFLTSTDNLSLFYEDDYYATYDVNEVGYCLRPNPNLDEFLEIYRREDAGVDEEPFSGGTFQFLHDRVRDFDIKIYSEDGPDAEPLDQWGTEDSENIGLPVWIEIELKIELAPRLAREQVLFTSRDRSTVIYKRVIRLPESLRLVENSIPMPAIPSLTSAGVGEEGAQGGGSDDAAGLIGIDAPRGGAGRGDADPFGGARGDSGGNPFERKD